MVYNCSLVVNRFFFFKEKNPAFFFQVPRLQIPIDNTLTHANFLNDTLDIKTSLYDPFHKPLHYTHLFQLP